MWVKICANTCLEDALAAVEFGADALGFVFAPSRRQVVAAQVREITRQLPPEIERVGVFAGEDADAIVRALDEAGLTAIQLHGGVSLDLTDELLERTGPDVSIIQTAHWTIDRAAASVGTVASVIELLSGRSDEPRLLVDAKVGGSSGGLGVSFDWALAQPVLGPAQAAGVRLIVAGGLRPDNVAAAIETLNPWGVDVASGVEREPGRKDYALLEAFIANAKSAHPL